MYLNAVLEVFGLIHGSEYMHFKNDLQIFDSVFFINFMCVREKLLCL